MIPFSGYLYFLDRTLILEQADLRVCLVKADFDATDRYLTGAVLVFADYAGYAHKVYTPSPNSANIDSHPYGAVFSGTYTFQPSGISAPQTIYGIALVKKPTSDKLLIAIGKFDAPITLSSDTHKIERGIDFFDREFTA